MGKPTLLGQVSQVLGWISLVFAGLLALMMYYDHHSGAWFSNLFDDQVSVAIPVLAVLGLLGILYGKWSARATPDTRDVPGPKGTPEQKDDIH
jgi:hypothetical protein